MKLSGQRKHLIRTLKDISPAAVLDEQRKSENGADEQKFLRERGKKNLTAVKRRTTGQKLIDDLIDDLAPNRRDADDGTDTQTERRRVSRRLKRLSESCLMCWNCPFKPHLI
ncbi:hypothetical protein F2P81_016593 [Scophthalmus maximus]|uniref:Uncharacterized protein n=1 Tax=Scophthalmus maximus TaxID=52904 RepID=A0A6A4SIK7_SCOMX|nr:hypothetical protein F2P81_016593 [Scophthalmus maximus]